MLYNESAVPKNEPGGAPPLPPLASKLATRAQMAAAECTLATARRRRRSCTLPTCGGPRFCVHRYMLPISREAAHHWRLYDARPPVDVELNDLELARQCVDALLDVRASPADMVRCGADAERLAVLGYTIDDLVRYSSMLFEHVVDGFALDWPRLMTLSFHPSLLEHRDAFPVIALTRPPIHMSASRMLDSFALSYRELVGRWHVTHEELYVLGFDVPTLRQIGMLGVDIIDALHDDTMRRRGVAWWAQHMHYTPALHSAAFPGNSAALLDLDGKATFASLVLHVKKAKTRT